MEQWRGALKDLRIDTETTKPHDPEADELTPDSMSSRLVDSAIEVDRKMDDLVINNMHSRVSTFAA